MQKKLLALVFALALVGSLPSESRAQTFLTPFAGLTFGGDAPEEALTTGASLTFMGDVAGFELDLGYTPDFLGEEADTVFIADSNAMTLMGNLLIGRGDGRVVPYGLVGVGLVRTRVEAEDVFDEITANDFGFSVGAGVIGMVSDRVGIRGDVRYFRAFSEDEPEDDDVDLGISDFDFWRATAGVSFRF